MQSNQGGHPGHPGHAQHPQAHPSHPQHSQHPPQQGHAGGAAHPQHPHAQHPYPQQPYPSYPQQSYPQHPHPHGHHPSGAKPVKPQETLYEGVCRHTASFGGYLKWGFASIAGGAVAYGLAHIEFFSTWPLWVLGLVGLPGIAWTVLQHLTTRYKVTTQRVEFERGVLSKTVDSLELWRVLDVRYKQTILDRILGNATIVLIGTDQTDPEMRMHGLPNHRQLFEKLRDAVQMARRSGRPMELVGGQEGFAEQVY
jgi:membrane protein YdbS with pleckstrin-like domain